MNYSKALAIFAVSASVLSISCGGGGSGPSVKTAADAAAIRNAVQAAISLAGTDPETTCPDGTGTVKYELTATTNAMGASVLTETHTFRSCISNGIVIDGTRTLVTTTGAASSVTQEGTLTTTLGTCEIELAGQGPNALNSLAGTYCTYDFRALP